MDADTGPAFKMELPNDQSIISTCVPTTNRVVFLLIPQKNRVIFFHKMLQ